MKLGTEDETDNDHAPSTASPSAPTHTVRYAMPTGRVVGIFQRSARDIVATLQANEELSERGGEEALLAIPMDMR